MPDRLERLLASIPRRKDLQIIIVDDCSDNFLEELDQLKDKYNNIEWLSTGSNVGAGKARNIGLEHAKGNYVIFADSDDYFNPCFNSVLDKYLHTPFDLVFFSFSCLNEGTYENSGYLNGLTNILHKNLHKPENIKFRLTYPWGKLYKRSLILAHGLQFEESIVSNDVKFSTLYDFYAKSIKIDLTAIYCYMVNPISVSRMLNREKILVRMGIDAWRWNFIKQHSTDFKMGLIMEPVFFKMLKTKNKDLIRECEKICAESGINNREFKKFLLKTQLKKWIYNI